MKFTASRDALRAATRLAGVAIGKGNEDEVRAHYVFRVTKNAKCVEVCASNGRRVVASSPILGSVVEEGDPGATMTSLASRLDKYLSALRKNPEVTATCDRGIATWATTGKTVRIMAVDAIAQRFPFYDEDFATTTKVGSLKVDILSEAMQYSAAFASTEETRTPNLVPCEARGGMLQSTNASAVCIVNLKLTDSKMRINGTDIAQVGQFMAGGGSENVTLHENPKGVYFRLEPVPNADGTFPETDGVLPILGITQWPKELPPLRVKREETDRVAFDVQIEDLVEGMSVLNAVAQEEDKHLAFRLEGSELVMAMASASGADGTDEWRIPITAPRDVEQLTTSFPLNREYLRYVLDFMAKDKDCKTITFGNNWTEKNGYARYLYTRDGIEYLTILVWLKQKPVSKPAAVAAK